MKHTGHSGACGCEPCPARTRCCGASPQRRQQLEVLEPLEVLLLDLGIRCPCHAHSTTHRSGLRKSERRRFTEILLSANRVPNGIVFVPVSVFEIMQIRYSVSDGVKMLQVRRFESEANSAIQQFPATGMPLQEHAETAEEDGLCSSGGRRPTRRRRVFKSATSAYSRNGDDRYSGDSRFSLEYARSRCLSLFA